MNRSFCLYAAACGLLALAGPRARADQIVWTERWVATPAIVAATGPGVGGIYVHGTSSLGNLTGSTDITAANLRTFSTDFATTPEKFNNAPVSLTLFVHDKTANAWGALTFSGVFNGTLSHNNANISLEWTSPTTQSLHLANYYFTVTMGALSPPGAPSSGGWGAIGATVWVHHNPEPSSLLLAAVGTPFFGAPLWRRWRRGRSG